MTIGKYAEDGTWVELVKAGAEYRHQRLSNSTTINCEMSGTGSTAVISPANALGAVARRKNFSHIPLSKGFDVLQALRDRGLLDEDIHGNSGMEICLGFFESDILLQETSFATYMPFAQLGCKCPLLSLLFQPITTFS